MENNRQALPALTFRNFVQSEYQIDDFPANRALWARLEVWALPGKLLRNRCGEAMNRAESRALWARISTIQAISLLYRVKMVG